MPNTLILAFCAGTALLGGLLLMLEVGYRVGRRARRYKTGSGAEQIGVIEGALLGLLALLLGFSFAAAGSRFIERQDLIVQEANAIGTAYLRADLLDEPHASRIREVLAQYVRHRVESSKSLVATGRDSAIAAQVAEYHARLWAAARDGVLAKPAMAVSVLDPVNEVIDLHAVRIAAAYKHLPVLVIVQLIACSLLAMGALGYGCGLSGARSLHITTPLALLIAASLWTTIDLDHPRAGLIRLSDAPLEQLNLPMTP